MTGYDREYAVPRYRPRWWAIGLVALAVTAAVAAARAQEQAVVCLRLTALNEALSSGHGERPAAEGIGSDGKSRLVVWANPDTGTWTAAVVLTSGKACLIGSGQGWEMAQPKREEQGS